MTIKTEGENKIVITPDNTAEMVFMRALKDGSVEIRKPEPFQSNVESLVVTKKEQK